MDSADLHLDTDSLDAHVTSFGIFFTSDSVQTAREIHQTLKTTRTAVVTCWKESALFSMLFDVQDIVLPANPREGLSFLEKWRDAETLRSTMVEGGFADVRIEKLDVVLSGGTVAELVESIAEKLRGMVENEWTEKEKEKLYPATEEVLTKKREMYLIMDTFAHT
ncbi:MAG: hypothetical protein M1821_005848 [Bathelium mastoideum]|nr:MAG: hypothetical protein M1821_005848 [Bathelium mastoideum]